MLVEQIGSGALATVWTPLWPGTVSVGEVSSRDVCQVRGWLRFNRCSPVEDRQAGRQVDRPAQ